MIPVAHRRKYCRLRAKKKAASDEEAAAEEAVSARTKRNRSLLANITLPNEGAGEIR
jgi:hypothetical protein